MILKKKLVIKLNYKDIEVLWGVTWAMVELKTKF